MFIFFIDPSSILPPGVVCGGHTQNDKRTITPKTCFVWDYIDLLGNWVTKQIIGQDVIHVSGILFMIHMSVSKTVW